ncbi:10216_t:CDS:1, partial [Ambispora gerdemannii]
LLNTLIFDTVIDLQKKEKLINTVVEKIQDQTFRLGTCETDTDEEIQQHSETDSNILENWQEYLADNPTQTNNENRDTNELGSTSQNRQLINLGQNNETSEDEKEGYWSETRHSNNSSDNQIITDDLERTGSNNDEIL